MKTTKTRNREREKGKTWPIWQTFGKSCLGTLTLNQTTLSLKRRRYRDKEEKNGKTDHKVPKHNKQIEKKKLPKRRFEKIGRKSQKTSKRKKVGKISRIAKNREFWEEKLKIYLSHHRNRIIWFFFWKSPFSTAQIMAFSVNFRKTPVFTWYFRKKKSIFDISRSYVFR